MGTPVCFSQTQEGEKKLLVDFWEAEERMVVMMTVMKRMAAMARRKMRERMMMGRWYGG